jgi:hypothetical protein
MTGGSPRDGADAELPPDGQDSRDAPGQPDHPSAEGTCNRRSAWQLVHEESRQRSALNWPIWLFPQQTEYARFCQ